MSLPEKKLFEALRPFWLAVLELLKIPVFALKEINITRAQKLSYALIFLYPILAMVSIAFVISGTTGLDVALGTTLESKLPVGVFFPQGETGAQVLHELKSFEYIEIKEFESRGELLDAISSAKVRIGVELTPPENEYSFIDTKFYYDNSNFIASTTIVGQVRTVIQNIGFKKSAQTLSLLLSDLNSIESKLNSQSNNIERLLLELEKTGHEIEVLSKQLDGINLENVQEKLDGFEFYYGEGKNDIAQTISDTNTVQEKIKYHKENVSGLKEKVSVVSDALDSVLEVLDSSINSLEQAGQVESAADLLVVRDSISVQAEQVTQVQNGLLQAEIDLEDTNQKLSIAREKLVLAGERLDIARENVSELSQNISYLQEVLSNARSVVRDSLESEALVRHDLLLARDLLSGLTKELSALRNYSPEFLSSPIRISIEPIYEFSRVTALVPFTVALVLLLTCLLLASISMINESAWGIFFRLRASSTTIGSWLLGKVLGQTIIALFESMLVFLVAIVFFSVPLPGNLVAVILALALISVCFVSIGLWITNFMKTASNSIFTALLMIVPMLFLSGIIVPLEFMPPLLGSVARVLPLTSAIELLQATYLRSAPVLDVLVSVIPLAAITIFCMATTYIYHKKKK